MIAGRKGHLSQPQRIRFTAPAMAPVEPGLLGHAYLLLIDRENPLSDRYASRIQRPRQCGTGDLP